MQALQLVASLFIWLGLIASAPAQDKAAIRIAVEGAYPPFNYLDQNNELQGFEVDLAKALCEVMQAKCTLVTHEWEGIFRGLLNREYDAIMSSVEITDRREKRFAFSLPYYRIPMAFIGGKALDVKGVTPQALAGRSIGVTDRSEASAYLEQQYKSSLIKPYVKLEEANLDLLTERLDLVFGDKIGLSKFLETREGACCRFIADVPQNPPYPYDTYAIGLRKDDGQLKEQFDSAIRHVIADGTYDRIREKYFSFDIK
ncbi:transporter substrate-binding domain-containing protein [Microvirga sp. 2MCAF38]|uniref:transporter substrate-binding domain-containing protein n=1 Tax=Microvirga sp. 2MCAF38 TaxID=3232989 RepID=UPI003F96532D